MSTYNIFISHAWKYSEHYNKIVQWLNEAQDEGKLTWKNYSVPSHDPLIDPNTTVGKNKLKSELKEQISPASKVIILAGMYAAYSDWIDFEIDTAAKGWKTTRMGKVDLALIRLAVYEIRYDDEIPFKVAVNEAVELAKQYGTNESPAFVNGILAKFAE